MEQVCVHIRDSAVIGLIVKEELVGEVFSRNCRRNLEGVELFTEGSVVWCSCVCFASLFSCWSCFGWTLTTSMAQRVACWLP